MKKKQFRTITIILLFLISISFFTELSAQCPMCRMSVGSNLAHGGTAGKGLNTGILYILSMPYLLVLTLGVIWYKNRRKDGETEVGVR